MPAATGVDRRWSIARPEVWLFTIVSAVLHFWHLFTPNAVVFDELYYERFAGQYLTHQFIFDVHPPLGRLMYVALARLFHVPAAALLRPDPEPILRVLPAAFGVALVPLVWLLLRQLGASRKVAALAIVALTFENALLVESRFILVDIFLISFGIGAMCAFLAARSRAGFRRIAFLALSALLAGLALSIKWTGASALGLVLAAWFIELVLEARPSIVERRVPRPIIVRFVREGLILTAIPAAIYLGAFAVHFSMLDRDGPGSRFMSPAFQRQLPGTGLYDPAAPKLSFWRKLHDYHHAVRYANASLDNGHNEGASRWYTWPIMKHPIGLWEPKPSPPPGSRAMIILLGNPVVWWGGLIGVLVGVAAFAKRRARFAGREFGLLFLLGGVAINYVPFMAIARLMYLYHYLFALVLVVACSAYATGTLAGWMDDAPPWRFASRRSAIGYAAVVGLILVAFVYFLPFTYGWTTSSAAFDQRFVVLHPF